MEQVTANRHIQSVDRALAILKCFQSQKEWSLTELSQALGLPKSTTSGIVTTLYDNGFLSRSKAGNKYVLGRMLYRLGTMAELDLRQIALPVLNSLVKYTSETVNLVVPDGNCVLYVDKIESPHSMRISTTRGLRLPMNLTAVGKAILSRMPEEEAWRIARSLEYRPITDNSILSPERLMEQVQEASRRGYATDREELEYGLTCVGTCVVDCQGSPVGAISISGPTSRMDEGRLRDYADYLMNCCREISSIL